MKKMIILLLALLIVVNNGQFILDNYSIYQFIDYILEKGYYDLIYWAKCSYDDEIAISVCLEFVPSIHCEPVVRTYMPKPQQKGENSRRASYSCPSIRKEIYRPKNLINLKKKYSFKVIEKKVKYLEEIIKKKCVN